MKAYGIMRVEKRVRGVVHSLQLEANRSKRQHEETGIDFSRSDIDWEKTKDNVYLKCATQWNKAITARIRDAGVKERKDSIVMIDGLYTASSEWFNGKDKAEIMDYFRDCLRFHVKEYCGGNSDLVINAVVHLDEATPHLHIASVPIHRDEKGLHLSAKTIMGSRADYRMRQDRFYDEVSKSRGLERGERKPEHTWKDHLLVQEYKQMRREEEIAQAEKDLDKLNEAAKDTKDIIENAEERTKEALLRQEKAEAEAEVTERLSEVTDGLRTANVDVADIIARHPAKKPLFGQQRPATVEISEEDYKNMAEVVIKKINNRVLADKVDEKIDELREVARDIHRNNMDAEAVAINERVQEAERRADEAIQRANNEKWKGIENAEADAAAQIKAIQKDFEEAKDGLKERIGELERDLEEARNDVQTARKDKAEIQNALWKAEDQVQQYEWMLGHFPEDWAEMEQRTKRAREIQSLRYDYQYGYVNQRISGNEFELDNEWLTYTELMEEYVNECERQNLVPDQGILEDLEAVKAKEHSRSYYYR